MTSYTYTDTAHRNRGQAAKKKFIAGEKQLHAHQFQVIFTLTETKLNFTLQRQEAVSLYIGQRANKI